VFVSLWPLLRGSHLGRCQAETPLIPLFRFPEPALSDSGSGCLNAEGLTETTTQSDGIGTTLIKELVRQIEGEFILMQDITGTTARVRIPLDEFR
jgi:hypothetical protein